MINHVLDIALKLKPRLLTTVISKELLSFSEKIKKDYKKIKIVVQNKRNGTAECGKNCS